MVEFVEAVPACCAQLLSQGEVDGALVPVMASAADEDSWHHIFPGPYLHTIMVNAIADFGLPADPVGDVVCVIEAP